MNSTPYNVRFNTNRYVGYEHPTSDDRKLLGKKVKLSDGSGEGTITAAEAGRGGVQYRIECADGHKSWINRTDFYPAS